MTLYRVPTDLESQGINLVRETSGNFVDGQGITTCIVRVVWLLFIFVKNMKIHIQCML